MIITSVALLYIPATQLGSSPTPLKRLRNKSGVREGKALQQEQRTEAALNR